MPVAIQWFRRDLRIADNSALNAATAAHGQVVPVFVLSHWRRDHHWCGAARQEFLCGCLASPAKNLEVKGGRLIVREGPPDAALEKLIRETGATAIYFARDPDPHGRAMEARVAAMAQRLGVKVHPHKDHALHRCRAVFPHPKSVVADEAIRSRRRIHSALGARTVRRAQCASLRATRPAAREGLPVADGRSRRRAGCGAGDVSA